MHNSKTLSVAAPWSLTNYIPLNGFHPLYRPLFEYAPNNIQINTWDNIKLFERIDSLRNKRPIIKALEKERSPINESIESQFQQNFWHPNRLLTKALPGDIEFHHTAPYASLTRPFVFHCESFPPIFLPFAGEGKANSETFLKLKKHYTNLLASDLCIGIFSHIPETLSFVSNFFNNKKIDVKLKTSRIGLCDPEGFNTAELSPGNLESPTFLFVNSANQNPDNFFNRGGHIVLRFWKELLKLRPNAKLILRCMRPRSKLLNEYGVDVEFIRSESNKSIVWVENYISQHEQNSLMANAEFFLLPSLSLHSVSLMQAMKLGAIPIVTDTLGTEVYVQNDHGIVLEGVKQSLWDTDNELGICVNSYRKSEKLYTDLVTQMLAKVTTTIENKNLYLDTWHKMQSFVTSNFSGEEYSHTFWEDVLSLLQNNKSTKPQKSLRKPAFTKNCMLSKNDFHRVFESPTQPLKRFHCEYGMIFEMGGAVYFAKDNPIINLNDWSVLAPYTEKDYGIELTLTDSIQNLKGTYLNKPKQSGISRIVRIISSILKPFPWLHSFAKRHRLEVSNVSKYFINKFSGKCKTELQLILENYLNHNIVYYYKYYALPHEAGPFDLNRLLNSPELASSFSLEKVLQSIRKGQ